MIGKAPQKGKAFDKLPKSSLAKFEATKYLASIKFDGHQVFIHKEQDRVRMYTSDWKEFHIKALSQELMGVPGNFLLVGEYLNGCDGKLGDRSKSAVLTTFRTNYTKGQLNSDLAESKSMVKVFDFIEINSMTISGLLYSEPLFNTTAKERILNATRKLKGLAHLSVIDTVELSGKDAVEYAKRMAHKGWEGIMLIEPDSHYHMGKRVNHSIKLKKRKTADLVCVGFVDGEDGFEGMIGSLILKDSMDRIVHVGSGGGSHDWRNNANRHKYLGSVIEIEYEQVMDTYLQATLPEDFLRPDKSFKDID